MYGYCSEPIFEFRISVSPYRLKVELWTWYLGCELNRINLCKHIRINVTIFIDAGKKLVAYHHMLLFVWLCIMHHPLHLPSLVAVVGLLFSCHTCFFIGKCTSFLFEYLVNVNSIRFLHIWFIHPDACTLPNKNQWTLNTTLALNLKQLPFSWKDLSIPKVSECGS